MIFCANWLSGVINWQRGRVNCRKPVGNDVIPGLNGDINRGRNQGHADHKRLVVLMNHHHR